MYHRRTVDVRICVIVSGCDIDVSSYQWWLPVCEIDSRRSSDVQEVVVEVIYKCRVNGGTVYKVGFVLV